MEEVLKKRVKQVRKNYTGEGCDAAIFTSNANVSYLTGFMGDDSWVMVTSRQVFLLTDSRYTEQAAKETAGCKIVARTGSMIDAVDDVIKKNSSIKKLAIQRVMPHGCAVEIEQKCQVSLAVLDGVVNSVRAIKDESEIANIRKAASLSKAVLKVAKEALTIGMTECELAGLIEYEIMVRGAKRAFNTIACFGAGGSEPHHIPGKKKLRKNDYVLIDYGAAWNGYCSDVTRSFAVGSASDEYQKAYEAVKMAQKAAIEMIAPGVKMADADAAARAVIADAGFDVYGHGTGHSFGLDIHEMPSLSAKCTDLFAPGHMVTIEPGIYIPGKFGIRIEDDVLVTETGYEIITRSSKSPDLEILEL